MHIILVLVLLFTINQLKAQDTLWTNLQEIGIEGKGFLNSSPFYGRLPKEAESSIREPVWQLSLNTAGILARFYTDAPLFFIKWSLSNETLSYPHISATGMSGIDVYVLDNQGEYLFMGVGIPKKVHDNVAVFRTSTQKNHSFCYLLNLPLYNGIKSVQIGVFKGYNLHKDKLYKSKLSKPIVFYGTSVVQGACASRAGMNYPAILGRKLGVEVVNLGFSGNAKLEPAMQDWIAKIDASIYVIDCHLNTTTDEAQAHIISVIHKIRQLHPNPPILIVEGSNPNRNFPTEEGKISKDIIKQLKKEGIKALYYAEGKYLLGEDTEGTVDLTHPNDLGFMRYANILYPILKKLMKK